MNKKLHNLTLRYALALIMGLATVLAQSVPMHAETVETNAPVPLNTRHPDAGIWFMYPWGNNSLADLQKPYIKGAMAYARWRVIYTGPNTYNWYAINKELDLIINQAGKKAMVEIVAGYCPDLEWPSWLRERVAAKKETNGMGCYPLQFWDPVYMDYYKAYIRALADRLAQFDSTDARPKETDITLVRAQAMAESMENLPNDNQMSKWEWQDFNPAPNGRIYKVNLTNSIKFAYHETIMLTYQQELDRAYAAVGLRAPAAAAKAASYWSMYPSSSQFAAKGIWFDQHNAAPNPQGWHYDLYNNVKNGGVTRATTETGVKAPTGLLAQYTYWEVLAALHNGVEFIGIYSKNRYSPSLQPKGPVNYAENWEALSFGERYAGHYRNPAASPGAWIALRGGYPEDNFGGVIYPRRTWTNYEYMITQYRPQDSVALYTNLAEAKDMALPNVKRLTKQPWTDEVPLCKKTVAAAMCDQISPVPTQYLRFANSYHEYTYGTNDLGKVAYCGTDMFCANAGSATRTESILWARRTNGAGGTPTMRFQVNDSFAQSLGGRAHVRIVYLDQGSGQWELRYDSTSGADKSALVVKKTNTNQWKEVVVNLQDVAFSNRQEGGTDLSLYNKGDDDDTFHMIEVVRYGGVVATGEEAPSEELPVDQGPPSDSEEALPPAEEEQEQLTPYNNSLHLPSIER